MTIRNSDVGAPYSAQGRIPGYRRIEFAKWTTLRNLDVDSRYGAHPNRELLSRRLNNPLISFMFFYDPQMAHRLLFLTCLLSGFGAALAPVRCLQGGPQFQVEKSR